jgi:hypothetical protein
MTLRKRHGYLLNINIKKKNQCRSDGYYKKKIFKSIRIDPDKSAIRSDGLRIGYNKNGSD